MTQPLSINQECNILVFGTGRICKKYIKSLESMRVQGFLDNDKKKQGSLLWGKRIYEPAEGIKKVPFDKIYIMAACVCEISSQLERLGVESSKIDSYLSIDNIFGEPILRNKMQKVSHSDVKNALKGNVAIISDVFSTIAIFKYICNNLIIIDNEELPDNIDLIVYHGFSMNEQRAKVYRKATERKIPIAFLEDGFLRSIVPGRGQEANEWVIGRSIILDGRGLYINAFSESEMERVLNSDYRLNYSEQKRAKHLIRRIVKNNISKYNNQPVEEIAIGRENVCKVLVIDQVPGDRSIKYGLAEDETFTAMLEEAITENPNADILIKTHPATSSSHYRDIKEKNIENVYIVDYPLNPISLLKYVDKVYVCTSQMGFEALMCDKEVNVFGMPFYAGWGVTNDRILCPRRHSKRTIEEIFFVAYVLLPIYISTKKKQCCEIEDVIDELLSLREDFFLQNQMGYVGGVRVYGKK